MTRSLQYKYKHKHNHDSVHQCLGKKSSLLRCNTVSVAPNVAKDRTALIIKGQAVQELATGTTHPMLCHIPEDLNPQQQQCDNLKSSILTM